MFWLSSLSYLLEVECPFATFPNYFLPLIRFLLFFPVSLLRLLFLSPLSYYLSLALGLFAENELRKGTGAICGEGPIGFV